MKTKIRFLKNTFILLTITENKQVGWILLPWGSVTFSEYSNWKVLLVPKNNLLPLLISQHVHFWHIYSFFGSLASKRKQSFKSLQTGMFINEMFLTFYLQRYVENSSRMACYNELIQLEFGQVQAQFKLR